MAKNTAKARVYSWQGTNRQGAVVAGQMTAADAVLVRALLRKQGITPSKVRKHRRALFSRDKAIKAMDIALFTRQMATMMKAGVPLLQSFDIIADSVEKPALRQLLEKLKSEIATGQSFAGSLRQHPRHFDELYCNLVASGEQSGTLEALLERVATYKEKTEMLKAKIKKAMSYPLAVVAVALIVTGILLIKVVPQFQEVFASFGAELPAFTLLVIRVSEYLQSDGWTLLLALVVAVLLIKRLQRTSVKFRNLQDRFLLKTPVLGNILYKAAVARFARTLATTFAAGVPLLDALDSVAGAVGNLVFKGAVQQVQADVANGLQLHFAMRSTGLFPAMALQLTAIGEESGALDAMLDKVAQHYEAEVDNAVDGLTALLEPMIMSVLGVLVGGLIIAMYLPIFELGAVV